MKNFLRKGALFCYRIIGSIIVLLAILMTAVYYLLPIFVSTDEIKATVLKSINLPIQFQSIDWGVWGLSPTVVIRHASLYEQKVQKITIELDWLEWLKTDKIKIKKIFLKKADLVGQFREDKIYLEGLPNYAVEFEQSEPSTGYSIDELVLLDSHIVLHNDLNQTFEAKHTHINLKNVGDKFVLDVKGRLTKEPSPFQFGLALTGSGKTAKAQLFISGEDLNLSDLQFFFKDILISGNAHTFNLWLEGEWGNFNRLVANGEINDFGYFYENRQLFYPYLAGQFGIEWKPEATEYLGSNLQAEPESTGAKSQFYARIPNEAGKDISLLAKDFPLNRLDKIFTVFMADKPGLLEWWQKTLPRGVLNYFDVNLPDVSDLNGHDLANLLKGISGEISARDLKINKNPFHLSVQSLSAFKGYYLEGEGKFALEGEETQFQDNEYYPTGLQLDEISGTIWCWKQEHDQKYYFDKIEAVFDKAKIEYDGFWEKNNDSTTWQTEGLLSEENFNIKQFLAVLPKSLFNEGLSEWMNTALIAGELEYATGVIRGKLSDFPYANPASGLVEVALVVEDVTVKYEPSWPAIKNTDGALDLDGPKLSLFATEGEIAESTIESAKGVIANIHDPDPKLEVDAKIHSTFPLAQSFIEHSPLKATLSDKLSPIRLKGPLDLSLDLKVPLNVNSPSNTEYRGLLNFQEASLKVPKLDLKVSGLKGALFFSPRGVSSYNLSGVMFGAPTQFSVVSDVLASDPRLKVSAKGNIEVAKLNHWFKLADSPLIGGKTAYTANLFLKHTAQEPEGELKIRSDLTGVTVNLPEPFQKKSAEKQDFNLDIQFALNSKIQMNMKYGEKINLDYELKATNQVWEPNATHVVVGKKPLEESNESSADKTKDENVESTEKSGYFVDNPFSIEGYLDTLDLAEWQKILSENQSNSFASNFFVKLKVGKLMAFGQVFDNMTVELASNGLSSRELSIIGDNIKGKIILPVGPCTSSIKAEFDYLHFPKASEKATTSTLGAIKTKAGDCPIEVTVRKLDLNEKIIESVYLHLVPSEHGFVLKNIRATAPNTSLQASGFWRLTPKSQIDLKGIIQTRNIYDTLKAGGIDSTMHAAVGQIRFDLEWEKDLTDIDLATIDGDVMISLRNGYIKGAEPGIGRILSLLSVDNILRRLQLDFSDVAKEGLAMDKLTASFSFKNGLMKTDDLILESPAARVELLGSASLSTKNIEGTVKVMPKITSSLPIAAAIAAGNPAVGAAVWMADKVLGRTIQEITHYQYQLSGTIDKPKLSSGKAKSSKESNEQK